MKLDVEAIIEVEVAVVIVCQSETVLSIAASQPHASLLVAILKWTEVEDSIR